MFLNWTSSKISLYNHVGWQVKQIFSTALSFKDLILKLETKTSEKR